MRTRFYTFFSAAALTLAGLASFPGGCSSSDETCTPADLAAQPTQRFPAGSTFYLPQASTPGKDGATCGPLRWELASGPDGNNAQVVTGADGFDRFTPIVAGSYQFRATGTSLTRALTVVSETSAPFENYQYYPSSSIAVVGSEVWIADAYDPHVTRLDPTAKKALGQIAVGPWPVALAYRPGMKYALVAQRASDTLGFVDVERGEIVDAVWVGDEPANVVVSPDGLFAYVSLATQGSVAIVNVEKRTLEATLPTNFNPVAMALTDDGKTLFVASYRSGIGDRNGDGFDDRAERYDIAVVDTASRKVKGMIESVGSVINGLLVAEGKLYVATTRIDLNGSLTDPAKTQFHHTVAAYDLASLKQLVAVDLGRQPSSGGLAVRGYGLAMQKGTLWVAAEGSDVVVGLDPTSLSEKARFAAPGRPRGIVAVGEGLAVHGSQGYQVTFADGAGAVAGQVKLPGDLRSKDEALGQAAFTGTGAPAISHSCTDCHLDALTDGNNWRSGIKSKAESRPLFWLEGTNPIGWSADGANLKAYIYGSPYPTTGRLLDDATYQAFYAFMASLVPPPPANGRTARDGAMTEAAQRGKAVFEAKGCVACHSGPLATNRLRNDHGTKPEPTDTPSLVGIYRYGYWLLAGGARTLGAAVDAMLPLAGNPALSAAERDDLVRYLDELTARDFFLLGSTPESGAEHVLPDAPVELAFSHPILSTPENLAKISLLDASGKAVDVALTASSRRVVLQPKQPLAAGKVYTAQIGAGFESWGEQRMAEATRRSFTVAGAPAVRLEGDYVMLFKEPRLDPIKGVFDPSTIVDSPIQVKATSTASGAVVTWAINKGLTRTYDVAIEGQTSYWPPLTAPAALPLLWGGTAASAKLVDNDGDGIADQGAGTLSIRSPGGLEADNVVWTLKRGALSTCDTASGTHALTLTRTTAGLPVIAWEGPAAIGYYVTEPSASPPAGPGPVTGGKSYWVVQTTAFPDGFVSPVSYGVVPAKGKDTTDQSGGPLGGAPLPAGECVKFSVSFADFTTSTLLVTW